MPLILIRPRIAYAHRKITAWLLSCRSVGLVALLAGLSATALQAQELEPTFTEEGLVDLQWRGESILAEPQGNGKHRRLKTEPRNTDYIPELLERSVDEASMTVTDRFAWGEVEQRIEVDGNRLRLHVRLTNTGESTIKENHLNFLRFTSPSGGFSGRRAFATPLNPAFGYIRNDSLLHTFALTDFSHHLRASMRHGKGEPNEATGYRVEVTLGSDNLLRDKLRMDQRLGPGETLHYTLEYGWYPADTEIAEVARPYVEAFRAENPPVLDWPDRRPIFRAFLKGGVSREQATKNMKNPDAMVMPEPDEEHLANLRGGFERLLEGAKNGNAQAMIFWDLEGSAFPHPTTYIGDPRLVDELNPQMALIVEEELQKFIDAGIRVGVTLRPSRVIYWEEEGKVAHRYSAADEPFDELNAKATFAKEEWGATVFYIDTNVRWRPYGPGPDEGWEAAHINPDTWRRLAKAHPDCLFIPEFAWLPDYASVCGYGEADMGNYMVSELAKLVYPDAFQATVIEDADPSVEFDRFVASVRQGNVLMTFGNAGSPNVTMSNRIYAYAAMEEAGMPAELEGASGPRLMAALQSGDARERFYAARLLRENPDRVLAPDLLAIVEDTSAAWPVRREALLALGEVQYDPAVDVMMELAADRSQGLYGDLAQTLVKQSERVDELILAQIEAIVTGDGNAFQKRKLIKPMGDILVQREAKAASAELEALYETMLEDYGNRGSVFGNSLLRLIGRLKNPDSVSFIRDRFETSGAVALGAAVHHMEDPELEKALRTYTRQLREAGNDRRADRIARGLRGY